MWLTGMMGSGKATVGRQAAAQLGVPIYETDEMVVKIARVPINAMWEGFGEVGFRGLYSKTATDVVETDDLDIADVVTPVIDIWDR